MNTIRTFVLCLLLAVSGTFLPSTAKADVSIGFFYDSLSPYGDWVSTSDYGYCWRPSHVSDDWRPYNDGYWAYTDDGWTWVSYEDYGGIVYHYGRWVQLEDEGWCWVPGTEWAPAWVSWRSNDDYVGWAPLPPEAHFSVGVTFGHGVDAQFDIGPAWYNFCPVAHFGDPDLRPVIVNHVENTTIINNTTNITNINVNKVNKTVYNGGPNFAAINQRVNKPIQRLNLVRNTNVQPGNARLNAQRKGNQLVLPAPTVTREGGNHAPKNVAKNLGSAKANRGWKDVTDENQRKQIREKFQADAQRPVTPEASTQPADLTAQPGNGKGKGNGANGLKKHNKNGTDLQPFLGNNGAPATNDTQVPQGKGKGEGKKHKGEGKRQQQNDATAQPFFGGNGAPATNDAQIPQGKGEGKKHKGEGKRQQQNDNAATQPFNPQSSEEATGRKLKKQREDNAAADAQAQELKRQRQAERAAQQQQAEKAQRQQLQQDQADKAARQQERAMQQERMLRQQQNADQAGKAERQQQRALEQQQLMRQQQRAVEQQHAVQQGGGGGGGGKGEGKKHKKDKDQPDQN